MIKCLLIFALTSLSLFAATVNGRFEVVNSPGQLAVTLQIQTTSGTNALGSSTIILKFNQNNISFAPLPEPGVDFTFYNFSGGNYAPAFISKPFNNELRINIELNFTNNGIPVSAEPGWTDIVTLNFTVLNPSGTAGLTWDPNNLDWGIYDQDNATKWLKGTFTDAENFPLPVELESFSAKYVNDKVVLTWKTATEINNHGFQVEKMRNGAWDSISFINGGGNSNTPLNYAFTDSDVVEVKNLYRLKQIDFDGKFEYSDVVEVEALFDNYIISQNYPNPFNPVTNINYTLPTESKVKISIFNALGEKVSEIGEKIVAAGKHKFSWNAFDKASGIYLFQITASALAGGKEFTQTMKMVLNK